MGRQLGKKLGVQLERGRRAGRHVGRKVGGQQTYGQTVRWAGSQVCSWAGRHTGGKVGIQVGRQASFEPAEGRLQKLVIINSNLVIKYIVTLS